MLELVDIKKPDLLLRLLHADRETIMRYIDLLEKS